MKQACVYMCFLELNGSAFFMGGLVEIIIADIESVPPNYKLEHSVSVSQSSSSLYKHQMIAHNPTGLK